MVAFSKVNQFIEDVFEKVHNLGADTLKLALTNTAPTAASVTWTVVAFPAPVAANGYTAGGNTISITSSLQTTGTYKQVLVDSVFTATAGGIGPFRYVIFYNSTATDKIVGYYDYGSAVTLSNAGDTFTVDFDAGTGSIQAS